MNRSHRSSLLPSFPPYHLKCQGISIWSLVNKIEVNNFQRLLENTERCRDGEELVVITPKNKKVSNVDMCLIVPLMSREVLCAKPNEVGCVNAVKHAIAHKLSRSPFFLLHVYHFEA